MRVERAFGGVEWRRECWEPFICANSVRKNFLPRMARMGTDEEKDFLNRSEQRQRRSRNGGLIALLALFAPVKWF